MSDGSIIGVGMDSQLYQRTKLESPWALVPNSGALPAVAASHPHAIVSVVDKPRVMTVAALPDGSVMAVGTDGQLYRRAKLDNPWAWVPNINSRGGPLPLLAIAAMPDGSILGVGTDNSLLSRPTSGSWSWVPNSGSVIAVAAISWPRDPNIAVITQGIGV
jgi:hypothetical protein